MRKKILTALCVAAFLLIGGAFVLSRAGAEGASAVVIENSLALEPVRADERGFEVEVLVNGEPLEEFRAHGRFYVEALRGQEYQLRIRNPLGERVAVALSVDGLNTIDARHTSAQAASKWVIGPYQTITVSGWQMSSARARHFYFTTEWKSYGASLGQTANLGTISAVFFRERRPIVIVRPPRRPDSVEEDSRQSEGRSQTDESSASTSNRREKKSNRVEVYPAPDDDYAATGIGRDVRNDIRWVNMDLQQNPAAEVTIRYEYRAALVRLGILPRNQTSSDALRRRERSTGFEDRRYSPEP